tara:strand:- start:542 stop:1534 length:993 start_codon:yes stop_codon:yes gene_type:complete
MNEEELKAFRARRKRWDERMALADKRRVANWKAITNMPMLAPLKAIPQLAYLGTSRLYGDRGSSHPTNLGWTLPQTMINPRPTIKVGSSSEQAEKNITSAAKTAETGNYGINKSKVNDKTGIAVKESEASKVRLENNAESILASLPEINKNSREYKLNPNKNAGATRWVGVNSEWRDRNNNVIAPREGSPAAVTTTPVEQSKNETPGVNWPDPVTPTIGQGDPKRAIQDRTFSARIQAAKEKDKINRIPNYSPPPNQPIQRQQQQQQQTNVTAADRMEAAGKAAAAAVVKEMIAKLTEPKKGNMGAINLPQSKSPDEDYLTALAGMSYYS